MNHITSPEPFVTVLSFFVISLLLISNKTEDGEKNYVLLSTGTQRIVYMSLTAIKLEDRQNNKKNLDRLVN